MLVELVNQALKKLKTILQSDLLAGKIHYIAMSLTVFLLGFSNWYFGLLFIPLFYLLRREKIILIISGLSLFIISINYELREIRISSLEDSGKYVGIVNEVLDDKIYLKINNEYLLVRGEYDVKPGDKIIVYGKLRSPYQSKDSFAFDYKSYLKRENIFFYIYPYRVEVIGGSFNINIIRYNINQYFKSNFDNYGYLSALILGDKNYLDEDFSEALSRVGVSHLFAISGLHIALLVLLLNKLLGWFKYKDLLIFLFLGMMMIITGFSPSVMRAVLLVLFKRIVKKLDLPYDSLDILSFIYILLLLINPYYFFNIGFELSFIVAFSFILSNDLTDGNYVVSTLKTSLISILTTLPIVVNLSNHINLITPLANVILILLFSNIFLPITFIVAFLPVLNSPYNLLVKAFEVIIDFINHYGVIINLPNFHPIEGLIYYVLLYFLLCKIDIKRIVIFLLFIILFNCKYLLKPYGEVVIFDVGQGDTTLVSLPFNQGNMVIDCFGEGPSYLVKRGVKHIDYLVITHSHDDHIGGAIELVERISVGNLIISRYDKSSLLNDLIKVAKQKEIKIYYLSKGSSFKLGNIKINVLGPSGDDDNLNNISLVLYFTVGKRSFLFMGDMEDKEKDIINYNIKVDYLKIGHHGSKTSSSSEFVRAVSPEYAIVSVGEGNKYDLPDDIIVNRYQEVGSKLHFTNQDGSFCFRFFA